MRTTKKVLSLILAIVLVLGLLPAAAFATGTNNVYISVSYDDKYINDKDGGYIAFVPVAFETLAGIDLDAYGLSDYKYDEDGDGTYEITALHLIIYAHEKLYGGDWSDVTFTGAPGSSYFQGGVFGFDENLNYYLNGQYPLAGAGWGATSDQIVLEAGDFINLAGFTSWDFYQDSAYGFHFFADGNGDITHTYTAEAETACDVKLIKGTKDYEYNSVFYDVPDYEISYGPALYDTAGTVTTDDTGCAQITFPSAGTWYLWVDGGYGNEYPGAIVSAPGYATVTVAAKEEPEQPSTPEEPVPTPGEAQDVSAVLNATMAKLAATVTEPVFGTNAGEWTVLSLARGGYFAKDNAYFTDYYNRIVETVNETAASVNMNGALHKNKSTENSRLIVALSSIGKDATSVGNWNLVDAYSLNGFDWIKKQGMNGTIWALIALDSHNYETSDSTIRQQCIDSILSLQHDDGGWALQANLTYASDPDVTGMALTALYPYRDQPAVAAACEEAFACLSAMQHDNGTFASGGSECSESCAWVIVATTTWGINPDTDSRFIKNGNSVVDGLLAHYLPDSAQFQHIIGAGANGMATDQSCYALVAYDRFMNGQPALYDYSDVTFEEAQPADPNAITATLSIPKNIENKVGATFNAIISVDKWNNEGGYKLVDFVMTIPEALTVTGVTAGSRLEGGEVSFHVDSNGLLRCVYFDTNENSDLTITGEEFPAEVFTVSFQLEQTVSGELPIAISGMSIKRSSDSTAEDSMIQVAISTGEGSGGVVKPETGITVSAMELYTGDGVDLIPENKKAIAVAVTGIDHSSPLVYNDGTNEIQLYYSGEITAKTGISTYVALVSKEIKTANFSNKAYYTANGKGVDPLSIAFGDTNSDAAINAQDALAVVDAWLRKGEEPTDDMILRMNVNGDSRINTFDALGIVEVFVNGDTFRVITKAATIAGN